MKGVEIQQNINRDEDFKIESNDEKAISRSHLNTFPKNLIKNELYT